jgi:hypothetical protein
VSGSNFATLMSLKVTHMASSITLRVLRSSGLLEKANSLNLYYSTVFSSEGNIPQIKGENTDVPFTIDIKTIRRRIGAIRKK